MAERQACDNLFESAYFKKTKLYLDIKTWSQGKLKREILFC